MQKKILFHVIFYIVTCISAQTGTELTFSEIMFNPSETNSEFIEIYNTSSTSIDLNGFKIKYYTSSADIIADAGNGTVLPPLSFAVLFENDYDLQNGIYKNLIPNNALILKIADNSFGSSGMANTSDRNLQLLNSQNDLIEELIYSADNNSGYSDEKVVLTKDNSSGNWGNSIRSNGSPGFSSTISVKQLDLAIIDFTVNPVQVFSEEKFNIDFSLKNLGVTASASFKVSFYHDSNSDSLFQDFEILRTINFSSLAAGDSVFQTIDDLITDEGFNYFCLKIDYVDDDMMNNFIAFGIDVIKRPFHFSDISITEIIYTPLMD